MSKLHEELESWLSHHAPEYIYLKVLELVDKPKPDSQKEAKTRKPKEVLVPGWYFVRPHASGEATVGELMPDGQWWICGCGEPFTRDQLDLIANHPINPWHHIPLNDLLCRQMRKKFEPCKPQP